MKFLRQHANSIILCLFEILVGILLLINPVKFTTAIVTVFGVVLIMIGVICVLSYFRSEAVQAAASQSLSKGLLALTVGIFCTVRSSWFITVFPAVAIIYGVAVLMAGLVKIQWAVDLIRLRLGRWVLPAVSAAISVICGVIILNNPFGATVVLWIFTGISLIVEAALDIIALFLISTFSGQEQVSR